MKPPANLKNLFGHRFKIGTDECFDEPGQPAEDKEWLYIIPCHGLIPKWVKELYTPERIKTGRYYPHIYSHGFLGGGRELGFLTYSYAIYKKILAAVPGSISLTLGSGEYTLACPLEQAEALFKIAKPKKRRYLTPEHLSVLLASQLNPDSKFNKLTLKRKE